MINLDIICGIAIWIACAVCAYGLVMGYQVKHWPWCNHSPVPPIIMSLMGGPISLFAVLLLCSPYHWAWHGLDKENREDND